MLTFDARLDSRGARRRPIRSCRRCWAARRRRRARTSWSTAPSWRTPAFRRQLCDGGKDAVAASNDPMIVLARALDADAARCARSYEDDIEAPSRSTTSELLAQGIFAASGTAQLPGRDVHAAAVVRQGRGLRARTARRCRRSRRWRGCTRARQGRHKAPFELPERWVDRPRPSSTGKTPMNFVTHQRHHRRQLGLAR